MFLQSRNNEPDSLTHRLQMDPTVRLAREEERKQFSLACWSGTGCNLLVSSIPRAYCIPENRAAPSSPWAPTSQPDRCSAKLLWCSTEGDTILRSQSLESCQARPPFTGSSPPVDVRGFSELIDTGGILVMIISNKGASEFLFVCFLLSIIVHPFRAEIEFLNHSSWLWRS